MNGPYLGRSMSKPLCNAPLRQDHVFVSSIARTGQPGFLRAGATTAPTLAVPCTFGNFSRSRFAEAAHRRAGLPALASRERAVTYNHLQACHSDASGASRSALGDFRFFASLALESMIQGTQVAIPGTASSREVLQAISRCCRGLVGCRRIPICCCCYLCIHRSASRSALGR
jgi:hypothetical protein